MSIVSTIVLAVITGILANLLTDRMKSWLANRSLVNRQKRLQDLKQELKKITEYHENSKIFFYDTLLTIYLLTAFTFALVGLSMVMLYLLFGDNSFLHSPTATAGLIRSVIEMIAWLGIVVAIVFGANLFTSEIDTIRKLQRFEDYKKEAAARIEELSRPRLDNR